MDLTTFGALLKFAMELEGQALKAYEEAAARERDAQAREALMALARANQKSRAQLERIYNESIYSDMDTGVQEPVAGLRSADYLLPEASTSGFLRLATDREEKARRFYLDAANQVKSRRSGVARGFERLAQEKAERKTKLESLYQKAQS